MVQQFEDSYLRKFYYLRLSLTDICNFKCNYCLPDGYHKNQTDPTKFLSLDEIRRVVSAFAVCGTSKIRLTGGEPTLRKDFTSIVEMVSSVPGIESIAMTTNGFRMLKDVSEWRDAGLTHINVSVDSLDPRMFYQITGENRFDQIMRGIDKAFEVGFPQIKVNAVLLKNHNYREIPAFLNWVKHRPIQLRFIELMKTGEMDNFFHQHHISGENLRDHLEKNGWQERVKAPSDGPARVFSHPDYLGEIGLIMPYEQGFCRSCNRLRVSAKGKLHTCLFGESGTGLRDLLTRDDQQNELIARIRSELRNKAESHFLQDGRSGMTPHLASIGG